MLYKIYKCYALFPNTLAVETFIMSLPKNERYFYDICIYSSTHSIRNYTVKLYFDIDFKTVVSDHLLNCTIFAVFTNVCDVLRRYYCLDYDISDLVVLDSSDHIDFNSDFFVIKMMVFVV